MKKVKEEPSDELKFETVQKMLEKKMLDGQLQSLPHVYEWLQIGRIDMDTTFNQKGEFVPDYILTDLNECQWQYMSYRLAGIIDWFKMNADIFPYYAATITFEDDNLKAYHVGDEMQRAEGKLKLQQDWKNNLIMDRATGVQYKFVSREYRDEDNFDFNSIEIWSPEARNILCL